MNYLTSAKKDNCIFVGVGNIVRELSKIRCEEGVHERLKDVQKKLEAKCSEINLSLQKHDHNKNEILKNTSTERTNVTNNITNNTTNNYYISNGFSGKSAVGIAVASACVGGVLALGASNMLDRNEDAVTTRKSIETGHDGRSGVTLNNTLDKVSSTADTVIKVSQGVGVICSALRDVQKLMGGK